MTMSVNLIMAIIMVTPVTIHHDSHQNRDHQGTEQFQVWRDHNSVCGQVNKSKHILKFALLF